MLDGDFRRVGYFIMIGREMEMDDGLVDRGLGGNWEEIVLVVEELLEFVM